MNSPIKNSLRTRPTAKFVLFVLTVLFYCACSPSSARNDSPPFEQGILWSIVNPENNETSYLIGTIHSMDTNLIKPPLNQLQELAMQTDILCLESVSPEAELNKSPDFFY